MIQLLKKDWRVNGTPIFGTIVLFVSLIFLMSAVELNVWYKDVSSTNMGLRFYVMKILDGSADAMVIAMMAMAAVFGGVAFATERRERSADFVAMLPIRKWKALLSKIVVAILCLACCFGFAVALHILASVVDPGAFGFSTATFPPITESSGLTVAMSAMLFGIAWMLSAFSRLPALCAGIAIAATFICPFILDDVVPTNFYNVTHHIVMQYCFTIDTFSGIGCFLAGSIYYLKRIEP